MSELGHLMYGKGHFLQKRSIVRRPESPRAGEPEGVRLYCTDSLRTICLKAARHTLQCNVTDIA